MINKNEPKTVVIGELEYRVRLKGSTKFAQYKPGDEWLGSTTPVSVIEKAIESAKNPKADEEKAAELALIVKETKKPAKKKTPKTTKLEDVIKAFSKGPQTMRQLNKATGHGPTAIRAVFKKLGDRIRSKQIPRDNAWSAKNTVTLWELV